VRKEQTVFGTIPGNVPPLANNATFCARHTYNFNFSQMSGVQLSSRASYTGGGGSNLGLPGVGVDAVLNFTPGYRIGNYTFAGVQYAWTNLDWPIQGGVAGRL
jgi:hypothetical protein